MVKPNRKSIRRAVQRKRLRNSASFMDETIGIANGSSSLSASTCVARAHNSPKRRRRNTRRSCEFLNIAHHDIEAEHNDPNQSNSGMLRCNESTQHITK